MNIQNCQQKNDTLLAVNQKMLFASLSNNVFNKFNRIKSL